MLKFDESFFFNSPSPFPPTAATHKRTKRVGSTAYQSPSFMPFYQICCKALFSSCFPFFFIAFIRSSSALSQGQAVWQDAGERAQILFFVRRFFRGNTAPGLGGDLDSFNLKRTSWLTPISSSLPPFQRGGGLEGKSTGGVTMADEWKRALCVNCSLT